MNLSIPTVLESCETVPTRRAYQRQLEAFEQYLAGNAPDYGAVSAFRVQMQERGLSPQNINQALAAIRFWANEALKRDWITPEVRTEIFAVKNLKVRGRKLGRWLSVDEAQRLINAPLSGTASGLRDRAILALLIGAGLRRSEICSLQLKHFEQRDGGEGKKRWLLIGITGKHGRTRNVPIADWVKSIVDRWLDRARIRSGIVFRRVKDKPERIGQKAISTATIYLITQKCPGFLFREPRG